MKKPASVLGTVFLLAGVLLIAAFVSRSSRFGSATSSREVLGMRRSAPATSDSLWLRIQSVWNTKKIRDVTPSIVPPITAPISCATGNVVETPKATQANASGITGGLKAIRNGTGMTVVGQAFPKTSTQTDWKTFFDAAHDAGIKVIPFFGLEAPPLWNGSTFTLGINETFLKAMKDHPALYAFFLIDEPFHAKHGWNVTTERLQTLYQQAKAIAPKVPMLVQYSREISKAETGGNKKFAFAAGQCDICMISALEFRNYGKGNVFDRGALMDNHTVSRRVITRENPGAQLWSTVQVFGSAGGKSSYYMPAESELNDMIDTLFSDELEKEGALDGLSWQAWVAYDTDDRTQLNLSKPLYGAHRAITRQTCGTLAR